MRVKVDKEFLIRFYILIREAERSLHSALSCDWSELRRGYPPEKIESFRQAIQEFVGDIDLESMDPRQSEAYANRLAAAEPNPFRVIFRSWLWNRARTFSFGEEIAYVATFLQQVAAVLVGEAPPQRDSLIALRMQISAVERIFQFRCCAIDEQPGTRMIWSVQDRAWRERHGLPLVYTTEDVNLRKESRTAAASAPSTNTSG
jgi:hypothetical protein